MSGSPHWTTPAAAWSVSPSVLLYGAAPLGPDGRVVDTPEVAVAKVAHQAAVDEAAAEAWTVPPPAWAAPSAWVTPPPPAWLATPPPAWAPVTSWAPVVPPRVDGRVAPVYYAARAAAAAAAADAVW